MGMASDFGSSSVGYGYGTYFLDHEDPKMASGMTSIDILVILVLFVVGAAVVFVAVVLLNMYQDRLVWRSSERNQRSERDVRKRPSGRFEGVGWPDPIVLKHMSIQARIQFFM